MLYLLFYSLQIFDFLACDIGSRLIVNKNNFFKDIYHVYVDYSLENDIDMT